MRLSRHTFVTGLALLALFAFVAREGGDGTSVGEESAFTYGAYGLEDEDGNFTEESGTEEFEAVDGEDMSEHFEAAGEEDVDADGTLNPVETDPAAPEIEAVYMMRVIWGQPFPNPLVPAVTDWAGTVSANGAVVRVRRLIRFERATGDGVSRLGPRALEVASTTKPHNDGLLLRLIQPVAAAADETGAAVVPSVSIDLGPVSLTYDLAELAGLSDIRIVDNMGNVIFVQAYRVRAEACGRGFVDGYWKRLNRRGGVFGGRWLTAEGEDGGRIAGIWGRRLGGHRVLFGIYRLPDGSFGGFLRGTYTPFGMRAHPEPAGASTEAASSELDAALEDGSGEAPLAEDEIIDAAERRPDGRFAARWISRNRLHRGVLHGLYAGGGEGEGRLRGRWLRACRELPTAGVPDTPTGCEGENCPSPLPDTASDGPRDIPAAE